MDTDNNKARSWGRLRVATSLKSIGGISLFLFCVLVRNVHFTSIESSDEKNISTAVESTAAKKKAPSTNLHLKNKIVLLGERHSGTNWITDHLTKCFQSNHIEVIPAYSEWKHWFQEDNIRRVPEKSAVVVAMFRDPYDWVEAMRVEPHHAHSHIKMLKFIDKWKEARSWRPLEWKEFVTKPWIGKENTDEIDGLADNFYELQWDGSGRAYSSIIDLRRDKIINHLSVANFVGTKAFLPMQYEDLNANGTSALLQSIEEAAGVKAKCNAITGKGGRRRRRRLNAKPITKHSELPGEFIEWMTEFVDWEVESRIGYHKRVLSDA